MNGEALRLLRVFHDVKLIDLAKKLQVSPSYLSEIENGKQKINLDIIEKYAKFFGVRVSALIFFSEEIDRSSFKGKLKDVARSKMIKLLQIIEESGKPFDASQT